MLNKIKKYKNIHEQIWLNVASSVYPIKDFVNLDNHIFLQLGQLPFLKSILPSKYHKLLESYNEAKKTAIMVRHDCRKSLPFEDNSVEHILCSHFLEHVYPEDAHKILDDFYRTLKPGGTIHIIVPDIARDIKDYMEMKARGETDASDVFLTRTLLSKHNKGTIKYRLLELHGGFGLQHRWMYDKESMANKMTNTGFKILDENNTPSLNFREGDGSVHIAAKKPDSF